MEHFLLIDRTGAEPTLEGDPLGKPPLSDSDDTDEDDMMDLTDDIDIQNELIRVDQKVKLNIREG
jgi:hypothetical protein